MCKPNSIYFSKVPKGALVHSNDGWVFMLTSNKKWNDKTFAATVVYGPKDRIGTHEPAWCADMVYTHEEYPCED